jgi:hypothetical protein
MYVVVIENREMDADKQRVDFSGKVEAICVVNETGA